ncbi:MAG: AAA family ATPase [Candidatus Komeilibacteria bacterium]|nr:AAA family ATPase [Candidatus Komeilibacteria bacterium]
MYLEKIDIQGFKSFAQPTTLVFNRELTAIVGPNGSGKSNIADAIRWVLGEQSLKLLRGKKSDDVIFSGSDTKGRLGFAKVTIYLNNQNREAGIDYDQVVIERNVNRSGESEYLVNGSKVRLTDVQILLAKAHVGQKSYSVIGQGMIDSLLAFTAQERKDFFDEATGVRHFQLKKNQAVHKLEQTEENLVQAELVLTEIEPRLRTLSRQVRRLERKEDLERQLKELQTSYYSTLMGSLTADLEKTSAHVEHAQTALNALQTEQQSIQKQLDALDREQSRSDSYDLLQKKLFNLQQEYNALTKKKIVLESRQDLDLIKTGNQEQVILKQRLEYILHTVRTLETERSELNKKNAAAENVLAEAKRHRADQQHKLKELERQLLHEQAATDWDAVASLAETLHAEHEQLRVRIEKLESPEHVSGFKQQFAQFAEKLAGFLSRLKVRPSNQREARWTQFTAMNSALEKLVTELHAEETAHELRKQELVLVNRQLSDKAREEKELQRELSSDTSIRQEALSKDLADLSGQLAEKEHAMSRLRSEIDSFNKLEEDKRNTLVASQKKLRTLQYDFTLKNNELTTLKVEMAKFETRKEELDREMTQEAPGLVLGKADHANTEQAREQIATLKKQLNIIGGIDTETMKEYQEVHEKHTFLKQQTTDLRSAQKSLIELIKDLDEHIGKQFQHAFKGINSHFTKYFKKLFNGGTAKLMLTMLEDEPEETEPEEVAETEPADTAKTAPHHIKTKRFDYMIEIQATPPGKKLASIAMLSGGEKALTAIALICSIIANNPPPFVVLDEVDAALDEANSIRFAEIIGELVDRSQFITITHNRATMHQAQILYGITMGDDGISRLLSVNFEQADKLSA